MSRSYVTQTRQFPGSFLSKTKASRFAGCPERFYRAKREPEVEWDEEDSDPDEGARGSFLHKVLEIEVLTRMKECRLDEPVSPDELLDTLRFAAANTEPDPMPSMDTILWTQEQIKAWARTWTFSRIIAVETPFSFELPCGKTFGGVIDVVRQHPDKSIEVVDWKTGAGVLSYAAARKDIQAGAYLIAARRLYPEAPEINFTFDYVCQGETVTVTYSDELAQATVAWADAVAVRLADMQDRERALVQRAEIAKVPLHDPTIWPARPGRTCRECGFRNSCPSYEEWVKAHGRVPEPPLAGLAPEELARAAIRSRTLAEVHDRRRKDAYAALMERMGAQESCHFFGHDFTKKSKRSKAEVTPDDGLQVLVDEGVPLAMAAEAVKQLPPTRVFDMEVVDKLAKNQPKGWKRRVLDKLEAAREVRGVSVNLECRETEGGLY